VRPLATFALLLYNQERFAREAVEAALAQTYSPLEIVVSDDCSTDDTFLIVHDIVSRYRGPHTVVLNRNERNLGLVGHLNVLMSRVHGDLIVMGGGDDVSLPNRVARLVGAYSAPDGQPLSIYSNMIVIDEDGVRRGLFATNHSLHMSPERIAEVGGGVYGCTHAWARRIFEVFGPLDEEVIHEDVIIPFRAAILGRICYLDEPLVLYRRHSSNLYRLRTEIGSWRALHGYLTRHASGRIAIYRSILNDIAIARKKELCAPEVLDRASLLASMNLGDAEVEADLLRGMTFSKMARTIVRRARAGTKYTRLLKWLLMAFAPRLYFLVWRYK
jgi:glycosyltransferase involved in cell wall biosynthesis